MYLELFSVVGLSHIENLVFEPLIRVQQSLLAYDGECNHRFGRNEFQDPLHEATLADGGRALCHSVHGVDGEQAAGRDEIEQAGVILLAGVRLSKCMAQLPQHILAGDEFPTRPGKRIDVGRRGARLSS